MSESAFWNTLRDGMKGKWLAQRHEDAFSEGIPDVSFDMPGIRGSGWIELKYLETFPKREKTIVRIPHYTNMQRLWIKYHGRINCRTFLFVQVGREYFLFDWHTASDYVGRSYRQLDFRAEAFYWKNHIDFDKLKKILKN